MMREPWAPEPWGWDDLVLVAKGVAIGLVIVLVMAAFAAM